MYDAEVGQMCCADNTVDETSDSVAYLERQMSKVQAQLVRDFLLFGAWLMPIKICFTRTVQDPTKSQLLLEVECQKRQNAERTLNDLQMYVMVYPFWLPWPMMGFNMIYVVGLRHSYGPYLCKYLNLLETVERCTVLKLVVILVLEDDLSDRALICFWQLSSVF